MVKNKKVTNRSKNAKLVDKNMTFAEIMEKHPELAAELFESGMSCFGCAMAGSETLEQGAVVHGINPDELTAKLNKKIGKKK